MERESGLFFDTNYFAQMVVDGLLDEAEKYLSGFTKIHDNILSTRIYFELRRQKYLEALDKQDRVKALDILLNEFKVFAQYNDRIFKEAILLLPLDNFRQHESLATYGDPKLERIQIVHGLVKFLQENPALKGKLVFPFANGNPSLRQLIYHPQAGSSSDAKPPVSLQL
ncbi:hypothetical protein JRO89_XS03G0251500 [Xanthoceras sorbifolium]|uniref:CTLH domain-containing protein n=1 Tax=Xanthoceras sorbifolium TaxID=99658 RepID=A0ABQ8IBS3_9ROSI|nr:hypothetical protein JRO89_XS03G0251500 [Xanthoceras sorbifolium]